MITIPSGWRLSVFYAALFAAVGIHIPFWPLWLKDQGLDASEIGWLVATGYLTRLIANPSVGHWVDHRGDRRRPLVILCAAAGTLWLLFPLTHGFLPLLAVTVIAVFPFTALMPVGDSLSMMVCGEQRLDYGRIRLWGSLAFIVTATAIGRLLNLLTTDSLPWLIAGLLLFTAWAASLLPDARVAVSGGTPPPLRPLLSSRPFLLFLGAAAFNQAAHTVYYAFATIHWREAGMSDTLIGLLWSEGVVAEIVLFAASGRVVARLGPAGLLLAAGLGGALRWMVLGVTTDPLLVALAQLLHAATFGCAHLGAMHFIQRAVPQTLSVRAQGIYAALAVGLAPGLVTPLSGGLYERFHGGAFLAMAVLSAGTAWLSWRLKPACVISPRE